MRQQAKVISFPSAENVKELYVGIMGEVHKPATYHVEASSLTLQSIVRRAGGLTAAASKTIRVVRHGKVTHKEVYSDDTRTPIFPGDLLIVDSESGLRFDSSRAESVTIRASYEQNSRDSVQLALLNLMDYPVVVRLRADEANAVQVVEKLGQPIELLATTYVITPDRFPRMPSEDAKRAIRLAAGSVLVFDRDRVNRNRLPSTLPKPIESDIASGAQPGLIGSPFGQSPELRNLGQQAAGSSIDMPDFDEQRSRQTIDSEQSAPDSAQSVNDRAKEPSRSIGSRKPRIANLPFTGVPRITTSSVNAQSGADPNDQIPNDDDAMDSADPTVAPSIDESSIASPAPFTLMQKIILFATVSILVGSALALRQFLETRPAELRVLQSSIPESPIPVPEQPTAGKQVDLKSLLERLIKNELSTVTEVVEFPSGLVLQGQIAERPILRVDGPQSILKQNGPHFGSAGQGTTGGRELVPQVHSGETQAAKRPHFMNSAAQNSAESVTNAASTEQPIQAPLAKALFQLEQGGRS